jgi:hypothetical protein
MKRKHKDPFVTLWDETSNTFTRIPKSELAPGMVPCRLPDRGELVWRNAASIPAGNNPYRHPPFQGKMRSLIESVVDAFPGLHDWSYQKWENLLRMDTNPDREIRYWVIAARVFKEFTEGQPLEYRKEVYRFLTICNVTPKEILPMVFETDILSADEVGKIADAYYGYFAG